ncbi:hypothetical protein GJ496_001399 [Pomphorhynchus laevis]|nr:hypothetical protein GJ496_001399 [Pomphorhynchus laevis]
MRFIELVYSVNCCCIMMKKDHVENDVFLIMYMQLPKIPEQTFRLFRWTDGHYTVHEGNARLLALHHYGSDSVLSEWTTSSTLSNQISIKTCKISANSITGVVFCILDILCSKIEIWEREKLGEWFCSKHVSPAYTLDLYSDLSEENSILFSKDRKILAISFPKRLCGKQTFDLLICVCVIDIDNQHCDIAEITDCEDSFLNLQNILTSVNPSELWIVNESNKTKNTKIRKLAEDFKIFIHDITQKPSGIEQENDQHLQVFDKQSIRILNYPENEITLYSVVVPVMKQLKLESKVQLSQQFTVSLIKSERYMRLDRAAVKAMMLFNDDVRLRSAKPTGNDGK